MPMPNNNELSLTIKAKILNPISDFEVTSEQYRLACNFISEWVFNNKLEINQLKIHKNLYLIIRDKFGLKSQMAISATKTVSARYQSVKSYMRNNPVVIKDKLCDYKKYKYYKTLEHLQKPIFFSRPQADLVRNRDYEINFDTKKVKITTMSGRHEFDFECKGFDRFLTKDWKLGTARLLKANGYWYLHIAVTKIVPEAEGPFENIVGIDRGLNFVATSYDSKGKTEFKKGRKLMAIRKKFVNKRKELQLVGTASAKRKIRKIGQRENRWMHDVNHCISKTLVKPNSLIVIEDLSTIKEELADSGSYTKASWAYAELASMLVYKARQVNSLVIEVDANYTSQRCYKCGYIEKDNRDKKLHIFKCKSCGYQTNDDRIAAMNLHQLGKLYLLGETPSFKKAHIEYT